MPYSNPSNSPEVIVSQVIVTLIINVPPAIHVAGKGSLIYALLMQQVKDHLCTSQEAGKGSLI